MNILKYDESLKPDVVAEIFSGLKEIFQSKGQDVIGIPMNCDLLCDATPTQLMSLRYEIDKALMHQRPALIPALNAMIEAAVKDGGDAGGAYHQNQEELRKTIQRVLNALGFDFCEVKEQGDDHWSRLYIDINSKPSE